MRASDLLGNEVRSPEGRVGRVVDLRVCTDADPGEDVSELRLDGLVVAPHHLGSPLGYDRRDDGHPKIIWWLIRQLHRGDRYVKWKQVRSYEDHVVYVDANLADLPGVPPLPAASHS